QGGRSSLRNQSLERRGVSGKSALGNASLVYKSSPINDFQSSAAPQPTTPMVIHHHSKNISPSFISHFRKPIPETPPAIPVPCLRKQSNGTATVKGAARQRKESMATPA